MADVLVKRTNHLFKFLPFDCTKCGSTIQFYRSDIRFDSYVACPICGLSISIAYLQTVPIQEVENEQE